MRSDAINPGRLEEGAEVTLRCHIEGRPEVTFTWSRPVRRLHRSKEYKGYLDSLVEEKYLSHMVSRVHAGVPYQYPFADVFA